MIAIHTIQHGRIFDTFRLSQKNWSFCFNFWLKSNCMQFVFYLSNWIV